MSRRSWVQSPSGAFSFYVGGHIFFSSVQQRRATHKIEILFFYFGYVGKKTTSILRYTMQFPDEIQTIINDYAKPASAMLREDWREGSSIIKILKQDRWWIDYRAAVVSGYRLATTIRTTATWTWTDWCKDKMIIGPPRPLTYHEEAELDEEYLSWDDIFRHCRPWSKTWPHPDDHSWCKVRAVPDWAKEDFKKKSEREGGLG